MKEGRRSLNLEGGEEVSGERRGKIRAKGGFLTTNLGKSEGDCDNPPRKISYYRLNQSTLAIKRQQSIIPS
jgi:hypothetical protein